MAAPGGAPYVIPKMEGFFRKELWSDASARLPAVEDLPKAAAAELAKRSLPARAASTPRSVGRAPVGDSDGESSKRSTPQAGSDPETPVRRRLGPRQGLSPSRPSPVGLKRAPPAPHSASTPLKKRPAAAMDSLSDDLEESLDKALVARPRRSSSAPGTPARSAPGTPARAVPGTPARSVPGTPARAAPGTPARAAPGTPGRALVGAGPRSSSAGLASAFSWQLDRRALALTDVPLTTLVPSTDESDGKVRPKRLRMAPLEAWRNESVIYERLKGSKVPSVCAVALNLRPSADWLKVEHAGLTTPALRSRIFTLPPWVQGQRPHTVKLAPAYGMIHVLRGSVTFAYDGEELEEAILKTGDSAALQRPSGSAFVAPACYSPGDSQGAQFWWVEITPM